GAIGCRSRSRPARDHRLDRRPIEKGHGQSDEGSHRALQGAGGWEEDTGDGFQVASVMLSQSERERYARHIVLPEIGEEGQEKLKSASVLIIGAGGLGSPSSMYLAAAGVGKIGLADFDNVDVTNLHRQILYGTSNVGTPKLQAARDRLHDLNPEIAIEMHQATITSENALDILRPYDVI